MARKPVRAFLMALHGAFEHRHFQKSDTSPPTFVFLRITLLLVNGGRSTTLSIAEAFYRFRAIDFFVFANLKNYNKTQQIYLVALKINV